MTVGAGFMVLISPNLSFDGGSVRRCFATSCTGSKNLQSVLYRIDSSRRSTGSPGGATLPWPGSDLFFHEAVPPFGPTLRGISRID